LPPWPLIASLAASGTPAEATAGSITGYLLGYGPIGLFLVIMSWLFFKGWRLIPPAREAEIRATARDEGRADLLKEIDRITGKLEHAEEQRDDAQQFTTSQLVPLLVQFTGATSALIPLLQELVRHREAGDLDLRRRPR
jgi:hypothetical protein